MAWEDPPPLQFLPRRKTFCCADATRFAAWVEQLFVNLQVLTEPTVSQVNVAQLALQEQWWDERRDAPKPHKDRYQDRQGRLCLYGVYVEAFARLRELGLAISPPSLTLPPEPRRKPKEGAQSLPVQAMGLFYEVE